MCWFSEDRRREKVDSALDDESATFMCTVNRRVRVATELDLRLSSSIEHQDLADLQKIEPCGKTYRGVNY